MITLKETTIKGRFFEYAAHCINGEFIVRESTKEKLDMVFRTIEENKLGVCLMGNPGAGKTFILDVLRRIIHPQDANYFIKKSCVDIVEDYNIENDRKGGTGDNLMKQSFFSKNIFWDDLGLEPKGKYQIDVMAKIMFNADERFKQRNIKSHFTCMYLPEDLDKRYGPWFFSRIQGMCQVIAIEPDQDFRPLKNFKGFPPVFHKRVLTAEEQRVQEMYKALENKPKEEYKPMGSRFREQFDAAFPNSVKS